MWLKANIPLVKAIPRRAAQSAREIIEHHFADTPRAVVDCWSEAEGAASVAAGTLVAGGVGEGRRGADIKTVLFGQKSAIGAGKAVGIGSAAAGQASLVAGQTVSPRFAVADGITRTHAVRSRQILHEQHAIARSAERRSRPTTAHATAIAAKTRIVPLTAKLSRITRAAATRGRTLKVVPVGAAGADGCRTHTRIRAIATAELGGAEIALAVSVVGVVASWAAGPAHAEQPVSQGGRGGAGRAVFSVGARTGETT